MNGPSVLASDGLPYVRGLHGERDYAAPERGRALYYEVQQPAPVDTAAAGPRQDELPLGGDIVAFPERHPARYGAASSNGEVLPTSSRTTVAEPSTAVTSRSVPGVTTWKAHPSGSVSWLPMAARPARSACGSNPSGNVCRT